MEDVLIIEKDPSAATFLMGLADEASWRIESAANVEQAEQWMKQRLFQAAVLDLRLPDGNSESLLARLKHTWPLTQFVVLAPEGDSQRGLRALKLGAYDSVNLPLERGDLEAALMRACERARMGNELRAARLREDRKPVLLGESPATVQMRDMLSKAAGHEANVLLLGEPGTGKQLAARLIHTQSARRKGPFVVLACADIPPANIERELFGTAAESGRLELAAGGTLLIQHVEFLSLPLQAKLMRTLQDRGFTPEDGSRFVPLDARVLASSGPALRDHVKTGGFREDSYWRLGATPLELPPLRARKEDIEDLFHAFLHRRCGNLRRATPVVRPEAVEAIKSHSFPGNVSELEALAHLVAALAHEDVGLADLPIPVFVGEGEHTSDLPLKNIVHAFERQVILRTLKSVRGNQSRAAERLDIHRNTLILKMQELDIPNKRQLRKGRPRSA